MAMTQKDLLAKQEKNAELQRQIDAEKQKRDELIAAAALELQGAQFDAETDRLVKVLAEEVRITDLHTSEANAANVAEQARVEAEASQAAEIEKAEADAKAAEKQAAEDAKQVAADAKRIAADAKTATQNGNS